MLLLAGHTPVSAQCLRRVSVRDDGAEANDAVRWHASISGNGRLIAFASDASDLVSGDTNRLTDIFVRDRVALSTVRLNVPWNGGQATADSSAPWISDDGRFVAFESDARNLVPGDTNQVTDVFRVEVATQSIQRVSVNHLGNQALDGSFRPAISGNGDHIAFASLATNLVPGDFNQACDVFVYSVTSGAIARVSVASSGAEARGESGAGRIGISLDGQVVTFESEAADLVPGDTNGTTDVFVHDRATGGTTRVSVDDLGVQGNGASGNPSLSASGRFVAFESLASNLVAADGNGVRDVFVHDRLLAQTFRVSVSSAGVEGNLGSDQASISGNGESVAFRSFATNFSAADTNQVDDVYRRDSSPGRTAPVSLAALGFGNGDSYFPAISRDGRLVAFTSLADNLLGAGGDGNASADVFVAGAELTFEFEPSQIQIGDAVQFNVHGGTAGSPVLLFLVDVNGAPLFVSAGVRGVFSPGGVFAGAGQLQSAPGALTLELLAVSIGKAANLVLSNAIEVHLQ